MRGQLSTEILILVGLVLVLLVPLLLYAYTKASSSNEDLAVQKAEFAVQRLASLSDSVGYLGGEAAIIDEIEVPSYIKSLYISSNGRDIVMEMDSSAGTKQIVQSTNFDLTSFGLDRIKKAGTYFIEARALSNFSSTSPGAAQVMLTLK